MVHPEAESVATLPIRLEWTAPTSSDVDALYGVFVDRVPVSVGEDVSSVADGDDECAATPGCPDEDYLRQRGVYTTTDMYLVLETLRDTRSARRPQDLDRHEVTIVLLDASGRRIDESYATREFFVDRSRSPAFG